MNSSNTTNEENVGLPIQEQEIDLMELAKKVWDSRKFILKVCGIGALVGLIIAISTPKEYTANILIAPESSSRSTTSSMGALAAMAGVNLGASSGRDAISPDLYPDIVNSTPFLIGLFEMPVQTKKDSVPMPLYTYMSEYQKKPWWSAVVSFPFKLIGWTMSLFKDKGEETEFYFKQVDAFNLDKRASGIAHAIGSNIMITVEKKTWVTTLAVTMQDPLVAATVADSVREHLQDYVTDYRTSKARTTLTYVEKLYQEAQADYQEAQKRYAAYADANQSLALLSSRAEMENLRNEMNLAYANYTQMAQQLQLAKAKVEEITPVYTIIQPASVPLRPSKPSKMMMIVGCVFLCGVGSVGWVLFVRDFWRNRKKKDSQPATESR
ncbi:Wzz/FepE/Etk N-terminal domain-containing protein [Bacteroides sp.]|uniref:Wzz/FepE/Etk N-terminal domain-containing protein n=1 Tax=Bacteroides sp. TaxID=29523 RepID=UPI003AB19E38